MCILFIQVGRGGLGGNDYGAGENGTVTGKSCPKGLYGTFCEECPLGTYKNVTGSDSSLCFQCPADELPHRALYVPVRGGIAETPCPYKCASDRYHMPNCYTALEELIYTFGGPWLFGLLLLGLLILLALVLSVARMKFVGLDESPGPAPTQQGSQMDHSFPFLESLNEVLETNRVEDSQGHVYRMYFMGQNTFSDPWHLPHTPPEQVKDIVYEGAFNRFVDEINGLATYQWWEGSMYSILVFLAYPLAWSWQQWRRKINFQRIREFVRSEYDHACLRSCRSRALYEGLKVASTSDLMLAYVDFFLGGDEKRSDLPPGLHQRFPLYLLFGGDGSYMSPFSLQSDNTITTLMNQAVPPTTWYRFVAGLNAQLRLVSRATQEVQQASSDDGSRDDSREFTSLIQHQNAEKSIITGKRSYGRILDLNSLQAFNEKRDIFFPLSYIIHNTKPVGHQDLVGMVISMLLLGDFSLVLLTLLQLYSISFGDVFVVLFILPLGILLPFPAGINALFSQGPRRSAGLARMYILWNIASFVNVVVAFICGYVHYCSQPSTKAPDFQPWNIAYKNPAETIQRPTERNEDEEVDFGLLKMILSRILSDKRSNDFKYAVLPSNGIVPANELLDKSRKRKNLALFIDLGMIPITLLWEIEKENTKSDIVQITLLQHGALRNLSKYLSASKLKIPNTIANRYLDGVIISHQR
nr:glycine-rich protein [Tanacetum cinerariifolium]